LAEVAGVPVVLNGMARGMLPPDHHLFASRARGVALGEADLAIVAGVPLDFRLGFGRSLPDTARVVYVDVDDFRKHRPPAAALYGDLRAALGALADAARDLPTRDEWPAHVEAANRAAQADDAALAASGGAPVHPARLVAEVERFCDPDAIVVGD